MAEKILSSSSFPLAAQPHSPSASVSAVHIFPLAFEVEQLRTEIALLKDTLASLQLPSSPSPPSVGIIGGSAMYLSIRHFRYFVEGCDFFIVTDHKPLTYAITSGSPNMAVCYMQVSGV